MEDHAQGENQGGPDRRGSSEEEVSRLRLLCDEGTDITQGDKDESCQ